MTSAQEFDTYIPVYNFIPEKWDDARANITEQLRRIVDNVNAKVSGAYLDQILLSGYQFVKGTANPNEFRSVFRKVVDTGALSNTGTTNIPHGLPFSAGDNFSLVFMQGGATDPVNFLAAPMPNQDINLKIDSTNIIITTSADYSAYTQSYVVVEYMREL